MNLADVRSGLKTNLEALFGQRVYDYVPGSVNVPCAIVGFPDEILFHRSMGDRAKQEFIIQVSIVVNKVVERVATDAMEGYAAWSGSNSVRAAIEADKTLDASCDDSYVQSLSDFGVTTIGNIDYWTFTANVWVHG